MQRRGCATIDFFKRRIEFEHIPAAAGYAHAATDAFAFVNDRVPSDFFSGNSFPF